MNVVTGGLGFIGNELVRQLVNSGEEVVILDNKNRIAPFLDDLAAVPVLEVDITNHQAIKKLLANKSINTVYHMAAIHYIPECNENPERTLRVNVEGTQSLLRAAAEANVKRIVFASSGAVYADSGMNLTETSATGPIDIYGWSKLFGEQLCQLHYQQYNTPIVIARLFNNYGPRETNPHIIPEILNQLKSDNHLSLGKITTVRDYIHTRDCAKALFKLSKNHTTGIEIVNVATGIGYTVQQVIELIGKITGRSLNVKHDSQRVRRFDKLTQVASISRLKSLTNWAPEIEMEEGVKDLLKFEGLL